MATTNATDVTIHLTPEEALVLEAVVDCIEHDVTCEVYGVLNLALNDYIAELGDVDLEHLVPTLSIEDFYVGIYDE